jgi:hypothetical protein
MKQHKDMNSVRFVFEFPPYVAVQELFSLHLALCLLRKDIQTVACICYLYHLIQLNIICATAHLVGGKRSVAHSIVTLFYVINAVKLLGCSPSCISPLSMEKNTDFYGFVYSFNLYVYYCTNSCTPKYVKCNDFDFF